MKLGDSGINVKKWQVYLNRWNHVYKLGRASITEDGVYGPITVDRTVEFQRWTDIEPTGQVGYFDAATMAIAIPADKGA